MVGGKDILRESGDPIQEAVNGINAREVNLDVAVKNARSLVEPDRKGMAKVEYGRGSGDKLSQKSAYNYGYQVAKDLLGYTTEDDQKNATRKIEKITVDTLVSFFEGYLDNNVGFPKYFDFFHQLLTEMGFDEKMKLFNRVAKLMEKLLRNRGYDIPADKVNKIRNQSEISRNDANELDRIAVDIMKHEYD